MIVDEVHHTLPAVKYGGSIIIWGFFAAIGIDALQNLKPLYKPGVSNSVRQGAKT